MQDLLCSHRLWSRLICFFLFFSTYVSWNKIGVSWVTEVKHHGSGRKFIPVATITMPQSHESTALILVCGLLG